MPQNAAGRRGSHTRMLEGIHDAVLIYNPLAGSQRKRRSEQLEAARRILDRARISAELQPTTAAGDATAFARRAVEQDRQLVIVCGGDGTINEAVNGLADSRVPLAVLPAGTANVLAKELGLPWSITRAAELIAESRLRRVALGELAPAEGQPRRHFLCVAGAGPDGAIVHSLDQGLKLRAGIVAYWMEGFRQALRYPFPRFRVRTAAEEFEATLVVVGRTKHYGGPFRITTEADLFGNQFELAIVTTRSALRYVSYLPRLWFDRLRGVRGVYFCKTTSLRCEPADEGPVLAQVDGEPWGRLPAEFRIVPDALTLAVPER